MSDESWLEGVVYGLLLLLSFGSFEMALVSSDISVSNAWLHLGLGTSVLALVVEVHWIIRSVRSPSASEDLQARLDFIATEMASLRNQMATLQSDYSTVSKALSIVATTSLINHLPSSDQSMPRGNYVVMVFLALRPTDTF